MILRRVIKGAACAAIMVGALSPVTAHSAEKAKRFTESQYRHDVMEHAKYSIGNIVQHLKGEAQHEGHMAKLAEIMALSAAMTKDAFSKDTRGMEGHTEAKAAIWENWEEFALAADAFEADAAAFAAAAKTGDQAATGAAFKKAASNCKSCHDKYKED